MTEGIRGRLRGLVDPRPRPSAERPATLANARRNATARRDRARRWRGARDALWAALAPLVDPGARVVVVGAGHCDDLPLTRLAARAGQLDLIDLDPASSRAAIRAEPRALRARLRALEGDASGGEADRAVAAARAGTLAPVAARAAAAPLGEGGYAVVVGDLLYSQLLYPGLVDAGVADDLLVRVLETHGPPLTEAVVARLHASAPGGLALHVHDPVAWWEGHEQPFTLREVLDLAARDPDDALALLASGHGPTGTDPRVALAALGLAPDATAIWHWPFAAGVDYLVCATGLRLPRAAGA
jgi:hypothetical protein